MTQKNDKIAFWAKLIGKVCLAVAEVFSDSGNNRPNLPSGDA